MASRRHLETTWRTISQDWGFEEIEGPTFEHLDLYTIKSGPGIVSELFSFERSGGDVTYALRPEFTPTLARMAVAQGRSLSVPTKWFSIPSLFRAERPQRGRLREHLQWNVDLLGLSGADADAEVMAVAIATLDRLGLDPSMVQIKYSHRQVVSRQLERLGVPADQLPAALQILDRRDKMPPQIFAQKVSELGLSPEGVDQFDALAQTTGQPGTVPTDLTGLSPADLEDLHELHLALERQEIASWCHLDLGIVRGLDYYTGLVFEIHETSGAERAIAGGGRYDHLVELFGGPSIPACGFGMGDVVLSLVLKDRELLRPAELLPRPDAFVLAVDDEAARALIPVTNQLRSAGLHARRSYKQTRNFGKLLKEAANQRSRVAVILGSELGEGMVSIKDLDAGEQHQVPLADLAATVVELCRSP